MNADNNLPINETLMKFESYPTNPKLYDGNVVTSKGTSSNPVRKIATKRRTSVDRRPTILALVQTFLQMIIALTIFLPGSPVLVAGRDVTERVTLQAGKPGVVPFHFEWPPNSTSYGVPYFTIRFESKRRPFCITGDVDIAGFKSPSQLSRFTTSVTDLDNSLRVNLIINNVDTLDEDRYVLTAAWFGFHVRYETMIKEVDVQIPPGSAKCFIIVSENSNYQYEVRCRATSGSLKTTLSCYQNDRKISVKGDIIDNEQVTSGIFLLPNNTHFSCCSHVVTLDVSETMCNEFKWSSTRQTVNTVPALVTYNISRPARVHTETTLTPYIESQIGSRASKQVMLHSVLPFTCLLISLHLLIIV